MTTHTIYHATLTGFKYVPCTCPDRTNERKWYTLVQVTSAVTPEDHDSETVIDWVRARCAVEAEGKARDGFHPVATFQGRRKGF